MSAQTSYNFNTPHGVAGGFYDLTNHVVDTRNNEEESGKVLFGLGVVDGSNPGVNVKLPTEGSKKENFEGIVVNSHSEEMDMDGNVAIRHGKSVGVCKNGRIYVRIVDSITPKYGEALYLTVSGEKAGYFTNADGEGSTVKVNGYFLGEKGTGDVAPVYIYVDKVNDAAGSASPAEKETLTLSIAEGKVKLTGNKGTSTEADLPVSATGVDGMLSSTDRAKITELSD